MSVGIAQSGYTEDQNKVRNGKRMREGEKPVSLSSVVFLMQELNISPVRLEVTSSTLTFNKFKCSQFLSIQELEPPFSSQLL